MTRNVHAAWKNLCFTTAFLTSPLAASVHCCLKQDTRLNQLGFAQQPPCSHKHGKYILASPYQTGCSVCEYSPDCSLLAASIKLIPCFPYLQHSAAVCHLLHDPRLPAELTGQSSTGKVSGLEKQSGGSGKRSQGGVGVVLSTMEAAAGWLFICALPSARLSVVSFPSCMKNEFSNASEPNKLCVPLFNMNKEWQCHFWLQAETQLFSLKPK